MVKYLTISLALNLLLFSLYSYLIGTALRETLPKIERYLTPLTVRIKVENLKVETPNNSQPAAVVGKEGGKAVEVGKNPKPRKSLLSELLPSVEKEYRTYYRRIVSKAKASLLKGGRVKLDLNRKVLYIPPLKPIEVSYPPAPAEVRITVLPDGRVIDAVLVRRSGNPAVDRAILRFAQNLRFAPITQPVVQEIYIEFRFKP
ncbi:MAG TPA: energy transducer TonB [Aquifex sp.]|nr:energy transducer TonB [Aquifex sp.]